VAVYADACNIFGDAPTIAHKLEVLRRHCDDAGRDPTGIEVTAPIKVADDAVPDVILAEAEALAAVGVQTIMARSTTSAPAALARGGVGSGDPPAGHNRAGLIPRSRSIHDRHRR
jgi:hypothetical protein